MRRTLAAVAVWALATLAAVALASAAIDTVVDRGGPADRLVPLDDLAGQPSIGPTDEPSAVPTSRSDAATAPPTAAGVDTRTYEVVGGSAAVRASGDAVELLWATPASGFDVDVDDDHPDEVEVEFRGDDHRSRLRMWTEAGQLRARVDEDPR